jgi:hypothetical protein
MLNNEHGYTTVELIIAMSMVGLITVFAYSVYIFTLKGIHYWQNRIQTENSAQIIINVMQEDLIKLESFFTIGEESIAFTTTDDDTISYWIEENQLLRNGKEMILNKDTATALRFNYIGNDLALDDNLDGVIDLDEIDLNDNNQIDGREFEEISYIELTLSLTNGNKTFNVTTGAAIRNEGRF